MITVPQYWYQKILINAEAPKTGNPWIIKIYSMLRFRSKSKVKRIPRNPFRLRPTGLASRWLTALPASLPSGSRRFCRQMRLRLLRLGVGKARSRDFQLFSHTDIDDDDCRLNPTAEKKSPDLPDTVRDPRSGRFEDHLRWGGIKNGK